MATLTQVYTAYGYSERPSNTTVLGFNGERLAVELASYLLGNGYRAFSPVLMRFHSPDSLSPFGEGGLNSYAYCSNEPVNRRDPTGHGFERNVVTRRPIRSKRDPTGQGFERNVVTRRPIRIKLDPAKKMQALPAERLVQKYNTLGWQMIENKLSNPRTTQSQLHDQQMLLINKLASRQVKKGPSPQTIELQSKVSSATPMIHGLLNSNDPFPPRFGPAESIAEPPSQTAERLRGDEWF
ncbi:RHS repeat-associated protein [Pseudomonas putida]|nr:RHS repeat-associated protein [Pseudomonas sp. PvP089]MBP2089822.1 RHS repeat-associated protein [Pseudomonas sp. PvP088]MBP2224015.1 RHS repeat-associated protein [Pseudomonas putida]